MDASIGPLEQQIPASSIPALLLFTMYEDAALHRRKIAKVECRNG
jgi:hypothetical protein